MANGHLQDQLTTCLTKETQQFDEVSLQAETILYIMPFAMVFKAALELGVIDMIASVDDGVWLSSSEITLGLPTKPTNPEAPVLLDRMLVLLASHAILKYRMVETGENGRSEKMERVYAAEPVCKFFLNQGDDSGSFAPLFMLLQSELCFKTMTHLKDLILEGKDAFSSAHGMEVFEYIGSNERFSEMFNQGMSEASIMIVKKVLEVYRGFEDVNTLVDVGGGNGTNMSLVTSKYPHIKGINFDLASALVHAPLSWNDEDCVKILKNCWRSLPKKGKVIIVEMITPKTPKSNDSYSNVVLAMDIVMLTHCSGGKERSLPQFESLAFQSGFLRCEVICLAYSYYVIELHK